MSEFGGLLKLYRQRCHNPDSGGPLTQARLAELLSLETGIDSYSGATVSNWERGRHQIRHDHRHVQIGLVKVLHQCGGIQTREEGDQLLLSGNYSTLNESEVRQINLIWSRVWMEDAGPSLRPSAEEQEAMLPPPSYTQLFGIVESRDHLLARLLATRPPHLSLIVGLGGLGKTALADTVARRAIELGEFAQVVWLMTEGRKAEEQGPVAADALFDRLIQFLSQQIILGGIQEPNPSRRLARVRNELKRHRHLVIIDNVETPDALNQLLRQLNALGGPSKFLLTARHYPAPGLDAYVFPLPELSTEHAVALMRYQAEVSGASDLEQATQEELAKLYRVVGGHPLALRLIPRLAQVHTLPDIFDGWQEEQSGYVARMYELIYESLWQALGTAEKGLLQTMQLVAPAGTTSGHLQAISGLAIPHFRTALTTLVEQCLIEPRGTAHERRYGIHSLTRQFFQSHRVTKQNAQLRTIAILENIAYWHQYVNQLSEAKWHTLDNDLANILYAVQYSLTLPIWEIAQELKVQWQELAETLFRYVNSRGYVNEWLPLLARLAEQFENDLKARCQLLNRLGQLYRLNQQLPQAIEIHQTVIQIAQQSEEDAEVARAHFNLGTDYYFSRQYDAADNHGQRALELFAQLGASDRDNAATLNLLGTIAYEVNNLNMSELHLREAATHWRQLNLLPELARTLNNLALTLQKQDKVEEAFACYTEAKAVLAKTASELDRILIYLSEGTLYFNLQRYPEAQATFRKIDLTYLKEAGQVLYQALTMNNLGSTAFWQGNYDEAEQLLQKSASIWREIDNEIELANTLSSLGDVLKIQGRLELAESFFNEVIVLTTKYPGNLRAERLKKEAIQQQENIIYQKQKG